MPTVKNWYTVVKRSPPVLASSRPCHGCAPSVRQTVVCFQSGVWSRVCVSGEVEMTTAARERPQRPPRPEEGEGSCAWYRCAAVVSMLAVAKLHLTTHALAQAGSTSVGRFGDRSQRQQGPTRTQLRRAETAYPRDAARRKARC
jgi:hypothetical protein